jgi:hypothetical protein
MEVTGALRNVLHLFKSLDGYVREYVMDDDASPKTILKHAHKTLLDASLFDMVDWPRNKNGKKRRIEVSYRPYYIPSLHSLSITITKYAPMQILLAGMLQQKSKCRPANAKRLKQFFCISSTSTGPHLGKSSGMLLMLLLNTISITMIIA